MRALDSDTQGRLWEPQRWAIATLLFAATLLNYLDRQALALVSPVLRRDLGLTATGYSHIVMAFLLGYTATQLFAGRVIDRIGPRRSLLIAMLWWSAAGIAAATAHSVTQLGATLLLMGIGEAANWPASVKAIQECFPPQQRAVAVGYFNSGSADGRCVGAVGGDKPGPPVLLADSFCSMRSDWISLGDPMALSLSDAHQFYTTQAERGRGAPAYATCTISRRCEDCGASYWRVSLETRSGSSTFFGCRTI